MLDNLIVCLEAVFPIFGLLVVGYVTKRLGTLNREDVARMNGAVYRVFMPAMVFYNLYTSDLDTAIRPGLVAYALIAVLLITGASLLLVIRTEPVRNRRGVIVQALYRSNLVIIGVPVVERLMGAENLGPVVFLMATVVPLFNVMAVVLLEYYGGEKTRPGRLLLDILKNPLIVGSLAGILALLLKLKLPSPLEVLVRQMANANSPILIFLLGVFFAGGRPARRLEGGEPGEPGAACLRPDADPDPGGAAGLSGGGAGVADPGVRLLRGGRLLHHGPADGRRRGAGGQCGGGHQRALPADDVLLVLPVQISGHDLRQNDEKSPGNRENFSKNRQKNH